MATTIYVPRADLDDAERTIDAVDTELGAARAELAESQQRYCDTANLLAQTRGAHLTALAEIDSLRERLGRALDQLTDERSRRIIAYRNLKRAERELTAMQNRAGWLTDQLRRAGADDDTTAAAGWDSAAGADF